MRLFSITFLLGILLLQNFSFLPEIKWIPILIIIAILLRRLPIFGFILGFIWCLSYAHWQQTYPLPSHIEGKPVILVGKIFSIPNIETYRTSFIFSPKEMIFENNTQPLKGKIRLSWQHSPEHLKVGESWQLVVKLKKIHGTLNPGGFDYEAWAWQEGIKATGYVVKNEKNKLISNASYFSIDRFRQTLKEKIDLNLPHSKTSHWINAFVLGIRNGIPEEDWEILRNTGTNHLMAIAGLHIGFMSGFVGLLFAWIWRRFSYAMLIFPAQHAGAVAALLMAFFYSALAGFSLPTQRACIMLSVFIVVLLMRRNLRSWHAWSFALLLVLLMNPLSVLTESFWLSFGAVALIIYGTAGRLAPTGLWWKWGRIQWVIALGLIPFSIWLFQECSIISFIANSIAIPCVGFLIVPLCLLGSVVLLFSAKLGSLILILADKILGGLWIVLTWFSHLPLAAWYQVLPNIGILFLACVGVFLLLIPVGVPGRYLGLIGLLPLFFYKFPEPKMGEVWLTLLDVGQGLSAVIQTHHHVLVFDTGPKLSANFDMGESVVVPFLRASGIHVVDQLVVSHGDNDHIGGAHALRKRLKVKMIKTSVPDQLVSSNTSYCFRGEHWQWDEVDFKFLYPDSANLHLNNDSSCVLKISTGNKSILLTGDIEKFAENKLIQFGREELASDILIAPHHGSKTSGENDFLNAVHPKWILFPIGYRNRYHFPHPTVIAKYDALGSQKIDTVTAGAIQFEITKNEIKQPYLYRLKHHHYWNR